MAERCGFWEQSLAGFLTTFMKWFPIPDQVIMGKLDGLGWMLAWTAYLVLITRK